MFFDGFELQTVAVEGATLRVRVGGRGPALLLLHGHPRTHVTWHRVAKLLVDRHTLVCPDLRGYGRSSKPATTPDHAPYSKRAMAWDMVQLMEHLGFARFFLAGHDRGAYVAFRLALDHPDRVSALGVLDAVPIVEALRRCDARFAQAWWHWFFFAQPGKPEAAICADPDRWYGDPRNQRARMGEQAYADFRAAIHDPATVHAMLEDYRAGLGIDRAHDEQDLNAGRRLRCRLFFGWAIRDDLEELYGDPVEVWRPWVSGPVVARPFDCGHHIAEERPEELAQALADFFSTP